jgi:signal transduction histidine kinase
VTSIQTRLSLWLLASVVILFGIHFLMGNRAPVVFTEEYMAKRLEDDAEVLMNGIRFDAAGMAVIDPDYVAPIYLRPNSGHYFLIRLQDRSLKSLSLGEAELTVPLAELDHGSLSRHPGPGEQTLLVWAGHYLKLGQPVSLAIAEELTSLEEHLDRFHRRVVLVTAGLFVLLIIIQRVIVRHSLKPLQRMEQACRELETGGIEQVPEDVPAEVRPLAREINRLVTVMQGRLVRSRNALGNLAHGLKTPLSLLSQYVDDRRGRIDEDSRRQARASVERIQSIIDRELKRARLAGPKSAGQMFHMDTEIADITGMLGKIHADKQLEYRIDLRQQDIQFGDREDMLELIGNLLDNASKWAKGQVAFTASLDDDLHIRVEDDGPGIPQAEHEQLTTRGVRLDESTQGSGLGLAIIQDIVDHYEGDIHFSTSGTLGGLRVDIRLPAATNRRS